MKILLTGASGFTGKYFAEAASRAGHVVVPLRSQLADIVGMAQEIEACQPDAVVHLAAISFVGHADEEAFYSVNTVGTTRLLNVLSRVGKQMKCVLVASSANIYGDCQTSPISETQIPSPINHYGASKLAMEHMALTYLNRLPIVLARPFNYTGPGQDSSFVIPKLVSHFARRAPSVELGNMHVRREFNDVRMVCDAYLALLELGVPGEVYNICTGKSHTLEEVTETLASLSDHHLSVQINPAFVRENEVHRLFGNPEKLFALCAKANVVLRQPELKEMLDWMLRAAHNNAV